MKEKKNFKKFNSFSFPCSGISIQATEEMSIIHTNKALAEDFLDYFQGINYSLC